MGIHSKVLQEPHVPGPGLFLTGILELRGRSLYIHIFICRATQAPLLHTVFGTILLELVARSSHPILQSKLRLRVTMGACRAQS